MIDIKIIDDIDYNDLLKLYQNYQDILPTKYGKFISAKLLNEELAISNSMALGLYNNSKLVGYIIGYGVDDTFTFSSMYVNKASRYYVTKFLQNTENIIKSMGYNKWVATSVTKQSNRMFMHYKAIPIEIKYYKEI
jgi:hypothetical protein